MRFQCNVQEPCNMHRATCTVQHAPCNMHRATCTEQHATCNRQDAPCKTHQLGRPTVTSSCTALGHRPCRLPASPPASMPHWKHQARNIQHATYTVHFAPCQLRHATCNIHHATCHNMQRTPYNMPQHAACNMQRARHNMERPLPVSHATTTHSVRRCLNARTRLSGNESKREWI